MDWSFSFPRSINQKEFDIVAWDLAGKAGSGPEVPADRSLANAPRHANVDVTAEISSIITWICVGLGVMLCRHWNFSILKK